MKNRVGSKSPVKLVHIVVLVSFIAVFVVDLIIPHLSQVLSKRNALSSTLPSIKTVFVIVMENKNWTDILGNTSAPYINTTLLPMASYANQYRTPPGNHPSLPNYLWLEAGTNFGVSNDNPPSANHQSSTAHLVTLLSNNGISWKSYQEGISGTTCPLTPSGLYSPKHNPMVFFDDITEVNNPNAPNCISHVRPYTELAADLQNNSVASYNFITPNLCDDMHNTSGCATKNTIKNGDTWLSGNVPLILNSSAYKTAGALFITWDEGTKDSDGPMGMIVLSPFAKGFGYSNTISYTHSSTLLTIEEIFGVTPLLGDAVNAIDLSDLFIPSGPPATPTPTGPPATPTPTPTAGTTLAQDTFVRPNQTHWGTASDGQTWGADANVLTTFSIAGNTGRVTSGGTNRFSAILGPGATDAQVLFSGSLSSFSNTGLGAVLRWTSADTYYQAVLANNRFIILKQVHGTLTRLSSTSFTTAPATSYTVRFQVVGTALSARVWLTSANEPADWMLTASDSSLTSGFCGLHMYLANGVTADITSFQATSQ